jgi:hypothetical protein
MLECHAALGCSSLVTRLQDDSFVEIEFNQVVAEHCQDSPAITIKCLFFRGAAGDGTFYGRIAGITRRALFGQQGFSGACGKDREREQTCDYQMQTFHQYLLAMRAVVPVKIGCEKFGRIFGLMA